METQQAPESTTGPTPARGPLLALGAIVLAAALMALGLKLLDDRLTGDTGTTGPRRDPQEVPVRPSVPDVAPGDGTRPGATGGDGPARAEEGSTTTEFVWDDLISRAEFDALTEGMSIREAGESIGASGEIVDQSGAPGSAGHVLVIRWEGADGPGTFATGTFRGGVLVDKSQTGLAG